MRTPDEKVKRKRGRKLRQDWAGGLKDLRGQYTSVELQHKISDWRVEDLLEEQAALDRKPVGGGAEGKADVSLDRISADPEVCHGKACIRGTRIPVRLILDMLAAGESIESVVEAYPSLSREDVEAAVQYGRARS